MQNMSRDDLVALLDDIRRRVATGDSHEGNIQYLISDRDHPYDVAAAYRTSDTVRLIGISVRDEPGQVAA